MVRERACCLQEGGDNMPPSWGREVKRRKRQAQGRPRYTASG
jgi:hypothetical protein